MGNQLKVGLVGTGNIATRHIVGWAASPDAELVAGMDFDASKLVLWGKENNIDKTYNDLADLLANPDIDIIDICTPNMSHTKIAIAALAAGKHVICEKPLAPTPADIHRLIAARDASGKELMTAQHYRFSGISMAMKREIDTGALGDVYHARSWFLRRNKYINTPTFVEKELSGGGACIDVGVHVLDLTLWLMGNPKPVTVSGTARTELARQPGQWSLIGADNPVGDNWDVEEFANAFVRFDNGATMMLEVSWLTHHNTDRDDMQIWLYGDKGGCHYPAAEFVNSNLDTRQHYNRTLELTKDVMEPHAYECV
ncbi:MAG: Gfo/Idh/MocA family protein, partial [Paracoccaceae bacterium]